jgi:hypothetical protein
MIGIKVIEKVKLLSDELIEMHSGRIQKAYAKQTDGKLTVGLSFVIQPSEKPGMIEVDATITYTMEKIKEKINARVAENQTDLPLENKVYKMKGE